MEGPLDERTRRLLLLLTSGVLLFWVLWLGGEMSVYGLN